jgi:hypothetical protein
MNCFVYKKYLKFYANNGYIPKMFNPYNVAEITDIAPCITANCGNICSSAAVLIIERKF